MLECAGRFGIANTPGLRSVDGTVASPWTDPSRLAPFLVSVRKTLGARMTLNSESRLSEKR